MTPAELDLIAAISPTHRELACLFDDHKEYERRLASLARQRWRSPADYAEEQRLKRQKLAGRDRIQRILSEHRLSA